MKSNAKENSFSREELFRMAEQATKRSYVPYSHFHVGAALLTESGEVFTGCNVENSSYGAAICAERTAAVKAVSEGHTDFAAIAVAGYSEEGNVWVPKEALPCGICRQFLSEFAPALPVITCQDDGTLRETTLDVLLACQFHL